jgi:ABC-2 type transport system permease protein
MSLFAGTWPMLRKEFLHLRRDPGTVIFALLIPVIQLIIFGFALNMNVRQIPTLIYDQAPSQRSRELIERFRAADTFAIVAYVGSDAELYGEIRKGRAQAALKIPYDYADRVLEGRGATVQLLVDGSDSTVSNAALNVFNALILLENQRLARVGPPVVEARPAVLFNPATRSPNFFVPGLVAALVQIMVIVLVALSVVRERERGTLDQLTVTPVQPLAVMMGKMIPYVLLGFVEVCWVLLIMRVVFAVPIHGSLATLLLLAVPFLVASAGMGLLISTRARSQAEAFQMAFGTMLPTIFLSGYIFPINNMPFQFQMVSKIIPTTYFIDVTRGVILRGASLAELWTNGAVLTVMALVAVGLAARQFHRQLT